jgi:hypothetical protein
MTVTLNKRNVPEPPKSGIVSANPNINRHGAWGIVLESYSADHSADVLADGGILLSHVPVASREWVCPGDEYTSGERNLPPAGARVFVMMPTGNFDGCFALCSGFVVTDKAQEEAFLGAEKEKTRKRVTPGNWTAEYDCVTGTYGAVSPDGKTGVKIDYGTEEEPKDAPELRLKLFDRIKCDIISDEGAVLSVFDELKIGHKKGESVAVSVFGEIEIEHAKGDSCAAKIFDTELVIKPGKVSVKTKKTSVEIDGDAEIKTSGKTTVEAAGDAAVKGANVNVEASESATVKAKQARITGGTLQVDGTAAPGSGPFCALPACPVTGAPHTGNIVEGT